MSFIWVNMLWLLLIVPVVVVIYVILYRRKRKEAQRYANLSIVRQAMESGLAYKRHIPPVLFLLALILMIAAIARPTATLTLGSDSATVMLAMDVSGSMRATDVDPNRILAAKAAAKAFVERQPRNVKIGVVAFSGTALLVQAPTSVRDDIAKAIDALELQRGTAVGSGLLVSLATLFPNEHINVSDKDKDPAMATATQASGDKNQTAASNQAAPEPVPAGSNNAASIILLTDGSSNAGPNPVAVAEKVANHGVRVYTVGFGTTEGIKVSFAGRSTRAELDEDSLKKVADITKGQYFHATSATDLKAIYENLKAKSTNETKETEITAFFAAAAALLAVISALLSMLWFNRLI
jgi:Ca-activated chloride channel family protein